MTIKMKENPGVVEAIISILNSIEVDGETTEYILEKTNMKEQMFRQLLLQANTETLVQLTTEKNMLVSSLVK